MFEIVCGSAALLLLLLLLAFFAIMWIQDTRQKRCQVTDIRNAILYGLWEYPGVDFLTLELHLIRKGITIDEDVYDSQVCKLIKAGLVERTDLSQLFLSEAEVRRIAAEHNEDVEWAVEQYKVIRIRREQQGQQLYSEAKAKYNAMTVEERGVAIEGTFHQWEAALGKAKRLGSAASET